MYIAIRRLKVKPGEHDEAIQRIANGFVHILMSILGFAEYIGSLAGHRRDLRPIHDAR